MDEHRQQLGKVYGGDDNSRQAIFEPNEALWAEHEGGVVLGAPVFSGLTLEKFQALPYPWNQESCCWASRSSSLARFTNRGEDNARRAILEPDNLGI